MYKFSLIRSISNFFIYIILNKKYKLYIEKVAMKITMKIAITQYKNVNSLKNYEK